MKASQLKKLASAAEASTLDLAPGPITLAPSEDGGIVAWYQGTYAACGIRVDVPDILSRPVSVAAREFQSLAGIFDDDADVGILPEDSALKIATRQRKLTLRYIGRPNLQGYSALIDTPAEISAKMSDFVREVKIGAESVSKSMSNPILTGIRLLGARGLVGIQTANASSLVFQSRVPGTIEERETKFEVIAPWEDTLRAFKMLSGDVIRIGRSGRTLVLHGDSSVVKIPLISGAWPNLADPLKAIQFTETVEIPAESVKSVAAAIRVYKAAEEIILSPSEGEIVIRTAEGELGRFEETIEGTLSKDYTFAVGDLETACKMCDGDVLKLSLSSTMAKMVTDSGRQLYILLRVVS